MCCAGKWTAAFLFAAITLVAGFIHSAPVDAADQPTKDPKDAKETKESPVDLSALREAITTAAKRGDNVDEIRKALEAFEKSSPTAKVGRVSPELQALRDAVEAASRKGENVDAIAKELALVETAVAGKPLAKPRPEPRPEPPKPNPEPNPPFNPVVPLPEVPLPAFPGGGKLPIDREAFDKATELRAKALELLAKDPDSPEAQKLLVEAQAAMLKALRPGAGVGAMPLIPELGRIPERARFGIRMERVPAVAADQLGLEANTGVVVTSVLPDSIAEKAGIKANDIVVTFAGKPVSDDLEELTRRVNEVKSGEKFTIVVLRKGKKVEIKDVEFPKAK